jgi:hypothetical protein
LPKFGGPPSESNYINSGTGGQLQYVNFSTKICLRFILGPLHTLTGLVKDVVEVNSTDFFRKAPPKGLLNDNTVRF